MDDCPVPVRFVRPRKELALLGLRTVSKAMRDFRPDVVMERFYNFAGAGILLAHRRGIPSLLEVNAPIIDPPNSLKSRLDRLLLGRMRRWAVQQAKWSAAMVTPLNTTIPPEVPRRKIHELPWGANVTRFDPQMRVTRTAELDSLAGQYSLDRSRPVAVFLGSFRAWHGVAGFVEAARRLIASGSKLSFLAIGGGPELASFQGHSDSWGLPEGRLVFTGPQPHDRVPLLLALGDIGVAPFDLSAHEPLRTFGFYWSPLKVFEYMAMGMPVVTVDVPPLNNIVRDGREGLLYPSGDIAALTSALATLEVDTGLRAAMGVSARARVVEHFSWQAHCKALDAILREIVC
jgi:glycosyltransferase involved in cell wall biosynthesis